MTEEEKIINQKKERDDCLKNILDSAHEEKKIIVAGAGTGKSFTFEKILENLNSTNNVALTFIRKLASELKEKLGNFVEAKTFHEYCKKILHEQKGEVNIQPFLTKIVEEDAKFLELDLKNFDEKFQELQEGSPEINFYIQRGDYYDSVGFNDLIYRLYRLLKEKPEIIPNFNQILIDEYQDFNRLETSFINELEKKGRILIVGDDDQAIYDDRCSRPDYLREKYHSGLYKKFELPYCTRCTDVVVKTANAFLKKAEEIGCLKGRIQKRYECYIEKKIEDNKKFPSIITLECLNVEEISSYIDRVLSEIDEDDISESWKEKYPTVLIVGRGDLLGLVRDKLLNKYPQILYRKKNEDKKLKVFFGYDILLKNHYSNLGWRILINFYLSKVKRKRIILESKDRKNMIEILDKEFQSSHLRATEIIKQIKEGKEISEDMRSELRKIFGKYFDEIIEYYSSEIKEEVIIEDTSKPSILFSTFKGCKGLSAGHVIIIGVNKGEFPEDENNIKDVEVCKFFVALTRTRKQCHIISNKSKSHKYRGLVSKKSIFFEMIPSDYIKDKGTF